MNASRIVVHEAELTGGRQRGRFVRAYCHLHGGDHQRSLSVNVENGYGQCFTCHAQVFVPELNPDGAMRTPAPLTAARLLQPPRPRPPHEPTPEPWQRDELAKLTQWYPRMRERLADDRARAYLEARAIPWDIAAAAGVGYIPADARLAGVLAKWRDRLVFPLGSPAGLGYAGRSLAGWVPGMDENAHKALLDADPAGPRRWEKTYPAGWFGFGDLAAAAYTIIVEGPVDMLALLAAAPSLIGDVPIVALVGTAARAEWIPKHVAGVVLALDGDAAGCERAQTLRHELRAAGLAVEICAPAAEDGRGKDWAERWRLVRHEGVWSVLEALDVVAIAA